MIPKILARYADMPLPRYTSYPTAPHFHPGVGADTYRDWLSAVPEGGRVSIYLHIPFCRSMCWYCGCHTTITARDEPIARYLSAISQETGLVSKAMRGRVHASHIHFGGGTPTLMQPDQFTLLMQDLRRHFDLDEDTEVAIEIDPRTLAPEMVRALAEGGITRASLGVQSFDPVVQQAINRVQTFETTAAAVQHLRQAGIAQISFDLIYGLPHQTVASCLDTVVRAVTLRPARFSVFGYAHVPSFKLHQRKIDATLLPDGQERHQQAEAIASALISEGYTRIGLDHFALPEDSLALAAANGSLHRNFQGYTTDDAATLIGLGASSIGRLPSGFVQNVVLVGEYQRRIGAGQLAVGKGCELDRNDLLRGSVIERIMCDYRVDLNELCHKYGTNPQKFVGSARGLQELITHGIAREEKGVLEVSEDARPLVRLLAAAFDEYLGSGPVRHSRAV